MRMLLLQTGIRVIRQNFKRLLLRLVLGHDVVVLVLEVGCVAEIGLHEVALSQHFADSFELTSLHLAEVVGLVCSWDGLEPVTAFSALTRLKSNLRRVSRVPCLALRSGKHG